MTESPQSDEFGPEAKFRPQLLLQWFVFPMLIVALCVGLYLSFSLLTTERKTAYDYLNDLKSGNHHKAWQAAFSLANMVNLDRLAEDDKPVVGKNILKMLEQSAAADGQTRQYFILTLGRLRYLESVPKLVQIAGGENASEKIYALMALREMKAPEAIAAAEDAFNDRDPGVRKTAAYLMGAFLEQSPEEASKLHPLLNDPVPDVRWNTALSLSEIVDPLAKPVISSLLDRATLTRELEKNLSADEKKTPLDEANVEKIIKIALVAASRFRDAEFEEKIRVLTENDPNVHVRASARDALQQMRGSGTPLKQERQK